MSFVGMPPTGAEEKRRAEKQRKKRVPPRRMVDTDPPPKPLYAAFDDEERRLLARSRTRTDMVWLDLRLVNWSHADHSLLLDLDTPLSSLARRIQERHCRIGELFLYRRPPPKNAILYRQPAPKGAEGKEFADRSLREVFGDTVGGLRENTSKRQVLYYDFKPALSGPLLLREPHWMNGAASADDPVNIGGTAGGAINIRSIGTDLTAAILPSSSPTSSARTLALPSSLSSVATTAVTGTTTIPSSSITTGTIHGGSTSTPPMVPITAARAVTTAATELPPLVASRLPMHQHHHSTVSHHTNTSSIDSNAGSTSGHMSARGSLSSRGPSTFSFTASSLLAATERKRT